MLSNILHTMRRSRGGPFHRRCNFCGGERFRVYKRLPEVRFPAQIYGDHRLTDERIGRRLGLQYLACTRCGLVGINPLPRLADVDKRSFDGERNIVAWADVDWNEYESGKRDVIRIVHRQYALESYRELGRVLDVSCGPRRTEWRSDRYRSPAARASGVVRRDPDGQLARAHVRPARDAARRLPSAAQGWRAVRLRAERRRAVHAAPRRQRDVDRHVTALRVDLRGRDAVRLGVERTPMRADFFNLMAEKPPDAGVASPGEAELRAIAAASLEELGRVTIVGGP